MYISLIKHYIKKRRKKNESQEIQHNETHQRLRRVTAKLLRDVFFMKRVVNSCGFNSEKGLKITTKQKIAQFLSQAHA